MNNWKDVPHLFANGKFFAVYNNSYRRIMEYRYSNTTPAFKLSNNCIKTVGYTTLIAHKIEDMTDEEVLSIAPKVHGKASRLRQVWIDKVDINCDNLSFGVVKHLLKHGVYPGPQSHFGETIIDIKTI